jgi:hypothetical protein
MAKGGQSRPRLRRKIVVPKLQESGSKAGEVDVLVDNIVMASPHFSPETILYSGKYQITSLRNYTYQISNI